MDLRLAEMALYEAMTELERGLDALAAGILSESLPAWTMETDGVQRARAKAAALLCQIHYSDGQPSNVSQILPGLVGCSAAVLALAVAVNGQKQRLKQALAALKGHKIEVVDGQGLARVVAADQHALARMGHARLHRLQAWRQIPILSARPDAVWFAWSESKKVYRISCAEAQARLRAFGEDRPHIALQLMRLNALAPDTPLAVVGRARPHARANLMWSDKRLSQQRASLPFLYPAPPGDPLPDLTPIAGDREARTVRKPRSDRILETEPLLPSIHAYAYRVPPDA